MPLLGHKKESEMSRYYVNKNEQDNGDHEVHKTECSWLPDRDNRIYLGEYNSCKPAVKKALEYYEHSNGCYWCSEECHTT